MEENLTSSVERAQLVEETVKLRDRINRLAGGTQEEDEDEKSG